MKLGKTTITFTIADKSPILYEDAKVIHTTVEFDPIPRSVLEYLAVQSLKIRLQDKYRNGKGEYGKIKIGDHTLTFKDWKKYGGKS